MTETSIILELEGITIINPKSNFLEMVFQSPNNGTIGKSFGGLELFSGCQHTEYLKTGFQVT